jgi:MoaA/NifB/PqqE/SkfB family radical SAM enzyme
LADEAVKQPVQTPEAVALRTHSSARVRAPSRSRTMDVLRLVFESGGPGFCQFAINNACNANCGFCGFARDSLAKDQWTFVGREEALDSIDILYRQGVRYLVFTGGEPTLHPHLATFVEHAAGLGMTVMVVTNAGTLRARKIRQLHEVGLSSLIISIDAASVEAHEANRGLPKVCERIRKANAVLAELGMHATASVTMSRLVDYDKLPAFLDSLGFTSVVFSYPLNYLPSNFLGFKDTHLVTYSQEELDAAYGKVKSLKKKFRVVNPTLSLTEMQRFVRGEKQHYPCLAGYRYFFLDWELNLWRCHHWHEPMCSIYEFDDSKLIRDGCTKCMINCYRDSSLMQHIAVSMHDAYQSFRGGKIRDGVRALTRTGNVDSIRSVLEEAAWILRF